LENIDSLNLRVEVQQEYSKLLERKIAASAKLARFKSLLAPEKIAQLHKLRHDSTARQAFIAKQDEREGLILTEIMQQEAEIDLYDRCLGILSEQVPLEYSSSLPNFEHAEGAILGQNLQKLNALLNHAQNLNWEKACLAEKAILATSASTDKNKIDEMAENPAKREDSNKFNSARKKVIDKEELIGKVRLKQMISPIKTWLESLVARFPFLKKNTVHSTVNSAQPTPDSSPKNHA